MWVARDKNDELWLYNDKPDSMKDGCYGMSQCGLYIDKSLFKDLKWEDGPIKVDITSNEYFTRVCKDPCINCFCDYPLCTLECKKYKNYVGSKR